MANGTLFTEDFLREGINTSPSWMEINDAVVLEFRDNILRIFAAIARPDCLNEAQTEERIVRPILAALGWEGAFSVQTVIGRRGRANVSDYTLFASEGAFAKADAASAHDDKLKHAVAVGDAKAWAVGLDQHEGGAGRGETPPHRPSAI